MSLRPETQTFIRELERSINKKLLYSFEVAQLIELSIAGKKIKEFEQLLFDAKFITQTFGIMKRIGQDGEGYEKLAVEFQAGVQRVSKMLEEFGRDDPHGLQEMIMQTFTSLDQSSMARLLDLLSDLAEIKNWLLDNKPVPWNP
ncbi:MAG: hypothetical protein V1799_20675 [bacterium]